MPKKVMNGQCPQPVEPNVDYELTLRILNEIKEFWMGQLKLAPVDDVKFARLSVVAFTQWAAMLGVDVGMTEDQFTNICRTQFRHAYERAPKFG